MLLGLEASLFLFVAAAAVFRILQAFHFSTALVVLVAINLAILLVANAFIPMFIIFQLALVLVLYAAARRAGPDRASTIAWFAFLGLIPANLHQWFGGSSLSPFQPDASLDSLLDEGVVFWFAGSSFMVIKSFVALKEWLREGRADPLGALAIMSFAPSYPAGPIHGQAPFRRDAVVKLLDARQIAIAVMQLGWGIAAFHVIAPALRKAAASASGHVLGFIPDIYLSFAALFFDFSGYSLMAIAIAAFFGITLPQNFNRPYLATSIREFWQRWHMSLSWFISTYLFKPFVRQTGSAQKGIFLAFVCAGLWHEVMPGYLLWGIGHGAALSVAMKPPAFWQDWKQGQPEHRVKFAGWILTMSWVALLSYTANHLF